MAQLIVNRQTLAGEISAKPIRGKEPLPWMMVRVCSYAKVWDRFGNITQVKVQERVVVQGTVNVKKMLPRMVLGVSVFAAGQRVPASAAGPDVKGDVLLADVFNIIEEKRDDRQG
jgi:hypothetical protein